MRSSKTKVSFVDVVGKEEKTSWNRSLKIVLRIVFIVRKLDQRKIIFWLGELMKLDIIIKTRFIIIITFFLYSCLRSTNVNYWVLSFFLVEIMRPKSDRRNTSSWMSSGVNFTNVLCAAFTYVSCECSFFVLMFLVCTLQAQDCWLKSCA